MQEECVRVNVSYLPGLANGNVGGKIRFDGRTLKMKTWKESNVSKV